MMHGASGKIPPFFVLGVVLVTNGAQTQPSDRLAGANASVAAAADGAASDPLRPAFHVMPAAYWINDPNGPIYFDGEYHLFYQHNPWGAQWGNMSWGHAVSKDLVRWERLPIALVPGTSYDAEGIFSGSCVIDGHGVPTSVYTGVDPEVQCIARSHDRLRTWEKFGGNPVIAERPRSDLHGFRDPFVWKEDDSWYMLLGSGIKGEGGAALLYRSPDLESWTYLHPLAVGFAENWECPNFFALEDQHVLIVSPHAKVMYAVGDYRDHRFAAGTWRVLDWGAFYASHTLEDPRGRRIVWGWVQGGGSEGAPWNGCISLPRLVTLGRDGYLTQEPLPELARLRQAQLIGASGPVSPRGPDLLEGAHGNRLEILLELDPGNVGAAVLEVLRHEDGTGGLAIAYEHRALTLRAGDIVAPLQPDAQGVVRLHVFVDHSVVEIFANRRECITARAYPADQYGGLRFTVTCAPEQRARVRTLKVWRLDTIWDRRRLVCLRAPLL
jgi:beta-fructofuranosidase